MLVHGDTSTFVLNAKSAVFANPNPDGFAKTSQGFIHTVGDDFVGHVV
jgi:hypothetical protein